MGNETENVMHGETIELEEFNIFLRIPIGAIRLEVNVKYADDDGEIREVSKVMNAREIKDAREDFLENVEDGDDYDVRYVLTEKGKEFMREMQERGEREFTSRKGSK